MAGHKAKAGTSKASAAQRKAMFVEAYLTNGGNATQAAKEAGYSVKTARQQGQRLLTDVVISQQIASRRSQVVAQAKEKTQLTAEEVLASLARDLRFDPAKLYREDGTLKPIVRRLDIEVAAVTGDEAT